MALLLVLQNAGRARPAHAVRPLQLDQRGGPSRSTAHVSSHPPLEARAAVCVRQHPVCSVEPNQPV